MLRQKAPRVISKDETLWKVIVEDTEETPLEPLAVTVTDEAGEVVSQSGKRPDGCKQANCRGGNQFCSGGI